MTQTNAKKAPTVGLTVNPDKGTTELGINENVEDEGWCIEAVKSVGGYLDPFGEYIRQKLRDEGKVPPLMPQNIFPMEVDADGNVVLDTYAVWHQYRFGTLQLFKDGKELPYWRQVTEFVRDKNGRVVIGKDGRPMTKKVLLPTIYQYRPENKFFERPGDEGGKLFTYISPTEDPNWPVPPQPELVRYHAWTRRFILERNANRLRRNYQ
jgi:hypothetical protein